MPDTSAADTGSTPPCEPAAPTPDPTPLERAEALLQRLATLPSRRRTDDPAEAASAPETTGTAEATIAPAPADRSHTNGSSAGAGSPAPRGIPDPALERADILLDEWGQRASALAAVALRRVRRTVALAREGLEDLYAEAEALRNQNHSASPEAPPSVVAGEGDAGSNGTGDSAVPAEPVYVAHGE